MAGVISALGGLRLPAFSFASTGSVGFREQAFIDARDVDRLGTKLKSFREPLERSLGRVIIPSIIQNFVSEGRPAWPLLADSTIAARHGSNHPILRRTGFLRRVAQQRNLWEISATDLKFRETYFTQRVRYAKFHQAGTRFMPQRMFVMFQPDDMNSIYMIFYTWLTEKVEQSWGRR